MTNIQLTGTMMKIPEGIKRYAYDVDAGPLIREAFGNTRPETRETVKEVCFNYVMHSGGVKFSPGDSSLYVLMPIWMMATRSTDKTRWISSLMDEAVRDPTCIHPFDPHIVSISGEALEEWQGYLRWEYATDPTPTEWGVFEGIVDRILAVAPAMFAPISDWYFYTCEDVPIDSGPFRFLVMPRAWLRSPKGYMRSITDAILRFRAAFDPGTVGTEMRTKIADAVRN